MSLCCPLRSRSGDRALCASRCHGTKIGWERNGVVRTRRGCLQSEEERERNWVLWRFREVRRQLERERALGSGEAAQINWFNCCRACIESRAGLERCSSQ